MIPKRCHDALEGRFRAKDDKVKKVKKEFDKPNMMGFYDPSCTTQPTQHQTNEPTKMNSITIYTRENDSKEYTLLEVNEDLNQITLRDTNTGTTLKMAKQTFANNFKKI